MGLGSLFTAERARVDFFVCNLCSNAGTAKKFFGIKCPNVSSAPYFCASVFLLALNFFHYASANENELS
jgi:hypothetical protein